MKPWRQGDAYLSRSDNPPELSEAMSLWGFPADFDPTQLPTGMFMCVMDEFTQVRIAKGLQKPTPPEPPPMRIGDAGDTIDRAGVRRKADGSASRGLDQLSMGILMLIVCCIGIGIRIGLEIAG